LIVINGRHVRAARGLLGWTQRDLSAKAKVALGTLRRIEISDDPVAGTRLETIVRIAKTLDRAGVEFLNDDRPGVRMKK